MEMKGKFMLVQKHLGIYAYKGPSKSVLKTHIMEINMDGFQNFFVPP